MNIFSYLFILYFSSFVSFKIVLSVHLNIIYKLKEYFKSDVILLVGRDYNEVSAEEILIYKEISKDSLVGFITDKKNFTEFFQRTSHLQNSMIVSVDKIDVLKNMIKRYGYLSNFWDSKIWVNFFKEDIRDELSDVVVPPNSKFLLVNFSCCEIIDVYQIGKYTPKIYSHFAKWNNSRLESKTQSFYSSRINLKGLEFKIVKSKEERFSWAWKLLSQAMNFNISWLPHPGGALYSNGTKTGMFKQIYEHDVDASSSNLVYNSLRLDHFDYIFPTHVSHSKMYVAMVHKLNWTSFIAPFDEDVWICVVGWTIIASFVLHLIKKYQNEKGKFSAESSLFVILKAICYQGSKINGSSISIYISHLMPFVLGVVLIQYYSAVLLSYLTVKKSIIPFRNLQEVVKDATYKIIVQNYSYVSFYFLTDLGEEAKIIRNGLLNIVPDEKKEVPFLCQKRQIVVCGALDAIIKGNCDIGEIPDPIFYETTGILVWKGFPYKDIMIKILKQLQFSGLMKFRQKNFIVPHENSESLKPLSLETVLPIFMLYISLTFVVLVITLWEILIHKKKKSR